MTPSPPKAKTPVLPRLTVADFSGSAQERARRHAEQLGDAVRDSGIVDFYRGFLERMLPPGPSALRGMLGWIHRRVAAQFSPGVRAAAKGFAEAGGFEEAAVLKALAMPDALNWSVGIGGRLAGFGLGCTSLAVWGDYTPDGRLLVARNLDFQGNGYWDRHPLFARHAPERGLRYVSIGTAGSIVDGITALNEAGLSVALHQHLSRQVGLTCSGRPIIDLAQHLVQTASTLDEAVEMLSKADVLSGWTVVLTHWKERRACAVEKAHGRTAVVRYEDGCMVRTNSFSDAKLRASEIDYPGFVESSRCRRIRAESLLEAQKGELDPARLAAALADHLDPERRRIRSFGQTIGQPHTIASVVFDPANGCAWIAEDRAPVSEGGYRKVPLWEGGPASETLSKAEPQLSDRQRQGYAQFHDAFSGWTARREAPAALFCLERAIERDPGEPIYRLEHGLFALMCGDLAAAADSLEAGCAMSDIPHRTRVQRFWQARTQDAMGRRVEAKKAYAAIADDAEALPALRRAARKGEAKPYRVADTSGILPDMIFADTYRYG